MEKKKEKKDQNRVSIENEKSEKKLEQDDTQRKWKKLTKIEQGNNH